MGRLKAVNGVHKKSGEKRKSGERNSGGKREGGGGWQMNWQLSTFFDLVGEMRVGIRHNGSGSCLNKRY